MGRVSGQPCWALKLKSTQGSLKTARPPVVYSPYVSENCWPLEVEWDDGNVLFVRIIGRFYVGGGSEHHRVLLLQKENIKYNTIFLPVWRRHLWSPGISPLVVVHLLTNVIGSILAATAISFLKRSLDWLRGYSFLKSVIEWVRWSTFNFDTLFWPLDSPLISHLKFKLTRTAQWRSCPTWADWCWPDRRQPLLLPCRRRESARGSWSRSPWTEPPTRCRNTASPRSPEGIAMEHQLIYQL